RNEEDGGRVEVDSGEGGSTEIGGTVDAGNANGDGGEILILGSEIRLLEDSVIIADGATNGGRILVGGGRRGQDPNFNNATNVVVSENASLRANAGDVGNGGEIIVFAENRLEFLGSLSATGGAVEGDGGFAELSGKNEVVIPDLASRVDLTSTRGAFGTLLFDPNDITIEAEQIPDVPNSVPASPARSNQLFAGDISTFLATMNLIIETDDSIAPGTGGDITFASGATITWTTGSNLTILADRNYIQGEGSKIIATGGGGVFVTADESIQILGSDTKIQTNSGAIELKGNSVNAQRTGGFSGIFLDQGSLSSVDGNILLNGVGGGGASDNSGVFLTQNASIETTGTGGISITGKAGMGTAEQHLGVNLGSSEVKTNSGDISITGVGSGSTVASNIAVDAQGTVRSLSGGKIRFETMGGEMNIGGSVDTNSTIELQGAATENTKFFVSADLETVDLSVNGGGGTMNELNFSDFSGDVNLQADQLTQINSLIGSGSTSDSFGGTSNVAANFEFTGADAFTYSEGASKSILVTGFEDVFGGGMNDLFLVNLTDPKATFGGAVDGRGGNDTFRIQSGSISSINGSIEDTSSGDVLDFSLLADDIEVDLDARMATFVGSFEDIETFVGSSGASKISGTTEDEEIEITGDGEGFFTIPVSGPPLRDPGGDDSPGLNGDDFSLSALLVQQSPSFDETVFFEAFDVVAGAGGNDEFTIQIPVAESFSGKLEGNAGDDTFLIKPGGSVGEIDGGTGRNTLDYTAFLTPVTADIGNGNATQVQTVSFIESLLGGPGLNRLIGTDGMDEFKVTGNGNGSVTFLGGTGNETLDFEGFRILEGAAGDDTFLVELPNGETFAGTLKGDGGEDKFVITPGGNVNMIIGGTETDTLDFRRFGSPVTVNVGASSATQVQMFSQVESVIGGSNQDTLIGRSVNDQFIVTGNGSGFLNSGLFESFEILRGQAGADQFIFRNQATVNQVFGGPGSDSYIIDDSNLGGTNTYTIAGNSVSRNPFYLFTEMEFLQLFLGPGNDTVLMDDNGLTITVNGGGGSNTIDFGSTPVTGLTPFLLGNTQVFATNFDNILLVRDESNNPENINPSLPGNGNPPGEGTLTDQFSNTGLGEAIGNAFSALASNALIAGQASLLQVEGGQVEAPLSLDGFFTNPPPSIVQSLQQSLQVGAWTELASAIGFGGSTILVRNDGPYSILLDQLPPNELLPILQQALLPEAGRELFEALEMMVVIPITSSDGAVSILAVPVQMDPAVLQQLGFNIDDTALSELTAALGE
ncbi:MAG: hypothetical protein AAF491_02335, partial [Verrucomicrobiota bacterium]